MWNQTTSFMPSSIQSSTYNCTEGLMDEESWLDPSLDSVSGVCDGRRLKRCGSQLLRPYNPNPAPLPWLVRYQVA